MHGEDSSLGHGLAKELDRKMENLLDKSIVKRASKAGVENVTITSLSYHGNIEESTVLIHNVAELHSGEWTCAIGRLQQKSVNIFVITPNTKVKPINFYISKFKFNIYTCLISLLILSVIIFQGMSSLCY